MKHILSLLVIFIFLSCSKDTVVNIRLKNVSNSTFESAAYNNLDYGELNPEEFTEYKEFESSYPYGLFSVIVNSQVFELIPIDFVGEKLLESGDYTFELDLDQSTLTIKLVED